MEGLGGDKLRCSSPTSRTRKEIDGAYVTDYGTRPVGNERRPNFNISLADCDDGHIPTSGMQTHNFVPINPRGTHARKMLFRDPYDDFQSSPPDAVPFCQGSKRASQMWRIHSRMGLVKKPSRWRTIAVLSLLWWCRAQVWFWHLCRRPQPLFAGSGVLETRD